jgi:tetratricopeptide (TPR) repeat protein
MASLYEFSRKISQHLKAKEYDLALSYFREHKTAFSNEEIGGNEYLISDMLSCLRHTFNFGAAFKFLDIYNVKINGDTKERILTSYGWLLYSKYKAENSDTIHEYDEDFFEDEDADITFNHRLDKSELIKRIEELMPLLRAINTQYSYTVISNLFTIVLKSEKKKPAPNWKLVNEFCDLINPDDLSTECTTIEVLRKGQKKDMELASDKENWFAFKSKALMKLGRYQECFEISKRGLETFDKFHYSNDIWFSRRVALSKRNLGNTEDTIAELKKILRKKKEWFIQKELAELLFEAGETEEAFTYSIRSINNFGDLEYKVDLLYLIGRILISKKEEEMAFKHFSLSKLIRQNAEWKIPQKLSDELSNFNKAAISPGELVSLKSELKKFWSTFGKDDKPQKFGEELSKGKIKKILNNNDKGKNGFLDAGGNSYYFVIPSNSPLLAAIEVGAMVEFKVVLSSDGKKDTAKIIKAEKKILV